MSEKLKKSIGKLFEKKYESQNTTHQPIKVISRIFAERCLNIDGIKQPDSQRLKSRNSVEHKTSSQNQVCMNSPNGQNNKKNNMNRVEFDPLCLSPFKETQSRSINNNKMKDTIKRVGDTSKFISTSPKHSNHLISNLVRGSSPDDKIKKEHIHNRTGLHDDSPSIRLRLNTQSHSRLPNKLTTFQQPVTSTNNIIFTQKTPIQLSISTQALRTRMCLSPSSSTSQDSIKGMRRIKGSEKEIEAKLAELHKKVTSKIERSFEKLFKELRNMKKEITKSVDKQLEDVHEILKSGKEFTYEMTYNKIDLPFDRHDIWNKLSSLIKDETISIRAEPQSQSRLSFDQTTSNTKGRGNNVISYMGKFGPIETSFTKFFENSSKLDFMDQVDPETYFEQKRNSHGYIIRIDDDQNEVLSESDLESSKTNFFQSTFKQ